MQRQPDTRQAAGTALWSTESPFLGEDPLEVGVEGGQAAEEPAGLTTESPFLNEYALADELTAVDAVDEEFAELVEELHDEELDEALAELVDEATEVVDLRGVGEVGDDHARDDRVREALWEHLAPLVRSAEETVDNFADELEQLDPAELSDEELDAATDRAEAKTAPLANPLFEQVRRKVRDKAKRTVKAGKKRRRRRGKGRGGLLKRVVRGLRKLIRPLINGVLQRAMKRLPEALRPAAGQVAARLVGKKTAGSGGGSTAQKASDAGDASAGDTGSGPEPADAAATATAADASALPDDDATSPPGDAQTELDATLSEMLMASDEVTQDVAVERHELVAGNVTTDITEPVARARTAFVRELAALPEGADAKPAVENFVMAISAGIKLGIKLIGRRRVIGFLGKMIATLIKPIVGEKLALPLGKAIADIGLKVVLHAEAPGTESHAAVAAEAVAATVEETVRRVAALPETVLDNEDLLEVFAGEAFERAVAGNFPPSMVRPELREAPETDGTWVLLPRRGRRIYKKFSHVFSVVLTPHIAEAIRSFGGVTLMQFFAERLRIGLQQPMALRVHLYEAFAGTRLSDIARNERDVRGLGQASAWRNLHPLTLDAAATLLHGPRLGRSTRRTPDPERPAVGERYYHLEAQAEGPVRATGPASSVQFAFDFLADEIRARFHLAEPAAQAVAMLLRRSARPSAVIRELRTILAGPLRELRSRRESPAVRVVLGPVKVGVSLRRHPHGDRLFDKAIEWAWAGLAAWLREGRDHFLAAADDAADGITLRVELHNPPTMAQLGRVLRGGKSGALGPWPPRQQPSATVKVHAGRQED
jgi:hypothetical protein